MVTFSCFLPKDLSEGEGCGHDDDVLSNPSSAT